MQMSAIDSLSVSNVKRFVLDNGLTCLFQEAKSADLVSVQLFLKTGSIHENEFIGSGISHFLEHILFRGTNKRSFAQICLDLEKWGASINAYTSFEHTVYSVDGPSIATKMALEILSDMMLNAEISEEHVEKERDVIFREIDMGLDDPDYQLNQTLLSTVFKEHPYKYPIIGERSIFKNLQRQDLVKYYKGRYCARNMVLIVVGNLNFDKTFDLASNYFSKIKDKSLMPIYIPKENNQLACRSKRVYGKYNVTRGTIAFKIPGLRSTDSTAIEIVSNILGFGNSSILYRRLREDLKLVIDINASIWNPGEEGLFCINYICDENKRSQVEKTIADEIKILANTKIEPYLLEKAIQQIMIAEINRTKTIEKQASRLGLLEAVIGDLHYPLSYLSRLKKQKIEDLIVTIKKYFISQETVSLVSLEPKNNVNKTMLQSSKIKALPKFESICFPNGICLLVQNWPCFPVSSIRVASLGGALYELPSKRGITSLLANLLTKDTAEHFAQEISQIVEQKAGIFSPFAGNNSFGLNLEFLTEHTDLGLSLLKNSLLKLALTPSTVAQEKEGQIAYMKENLDDVFYFGVQRLRDRFFSKHPYGMSPEGDENTVSKITVADLKIQKDKLLTPCNIVFSASGILERSKLKDMVGYIDSNLRESKFIPKHIPFCCNKKTKNFEIEFCSHQTLIYNAYPMIGICHKKFEITEVLEELLSGMSSHLSEITREDLGIVYFVGASRIAGLNTGMFYLYGGTNNENKIKLQNKFVDEIERLKIGNNKLVCELENAKMKLKVQKRTNLQRASFRTLDVGLNMLYDIPVDYWLTYEQRIDAVTLDDIVSFVREFFTIDNRVSLVINPMRL